MKRQIAYKCRYGPPCPYASHRDAKNILKINATAIGIPTTDRPHHNKQTNRPPTP